MLAAVADDRAGVAAEVSLDGGAFVPVSLAADGTVSFTPALPLDGSADGPHTVALRGRDAAGNRSAARATAFTLDTRPPVLTLALAGGGLTTQDGTVSLRGTTEPGLTVRLGDAGPAAVAGPDGVFTFPGVTLALGTNPFTAAASDEAGNRGSVSVAVTRTAPAGSPTVAARLLSDTAPGGGTNADGLTRDPVVTGTVTTFDGASVAGLEARVGAGAYADVTGSLTGGAFTLSRVTLAALAGGPLADGPVTVAVRAVDGRGRSSAPAVVAFTLDTTAPIVPALVTPAGGTTTTLAVATLSGVAEPGAVLTLDPGGRTATAGAAGAFSFPDVQLVVGNNTFTLVAADAAGNAASAARAVTRTIESGGGTTPTPELAPASNTGRVPAANRTNLTTPAVRVETAVGDTVEFFVDGNSVGAATATGNPTTFILPALADGPHAVAAQRTSAGGLGDARSAALTVTVDTAAPAAATLAVPAASQAGGPRTVAAARVTLAGTAEPDAVVALVGSVKTALAGADGTYTLTDVSLALGENVLTLTVTDAAGNVTTAAAAPITRVPTPVGQADPVLGWVDQTLAAVRADASSPPVASRAMGMAFGAMGDAVAAIEGRTGQFVTRTAPAGTSAAAAVAAAARDVLAYLYPAQVAALDAAQAASLAAVPDGQAKTDGIALGRAVAAAVVAQRDGDGWDRFATYSTAGGQGGWVPTGPAYAEPLLPAWGQVAPFALTAGDQFRPAAPYALTSPEYAADLAEVRSLGRRDSTARTADQTQVARFWADGGGTSTPAGHWVALARQVAAEKGNSLSANARLMAVLGAAMADAAIACWDAKYAYGFWRPDTAIEKDPAAPDAGWAPLITTPPFPEYMSGHATFSGAAAEILADAFGDDVGFTLTSEGLPGVTRTFASFSQAAAEGGRSRVYGGIHFQLSNAVGQDVGRKVGRRVLDVFNTAADTVAPTTTVTGEVPAATRTNPTITGRVRDNLSGVATLTVSVDGGPAAPVAFDAAGNFTVTTALALDGTAEGRHTLAFVATDKAGNTFSGPTVAFVLATRAPNLTVTAPAAGAALAAGALLTGSVAGSTAPIARLTYQFAGQPAVPVIVGPAGTFSAALDLSRLAAGDHSLTVTATDAAGNTAAVTRAATLAAAVPFRVSQTAPAAGSSEVGVTFRPQVFFTRPANPATLTAQTITATDAAGNSIPLSIVPADDGTFAWVYFTNPLPGGTRVTLAVNGDLITAPDGTKLDADADGTPGGRSSVSFTTVSTAAVPGTTLTGVLADPGPDNKPFTFDDAGAGPDGSLMTGDDVYKKPIAGVTIYALGREDNAVLTDAQGRFTLSNLPAGNVKLILNGRTATNAPAGFYFPEMTLDLSVKPGVSQTVMGSMGTGDQQRGLAGVTGVHLPRVALAALETVSNAAAAPVTIDLNPASSQGLTPEQASQLTVTLQPGSLLGEDGQKVETAQIGISTVPPELVRDMLPPGVLQHTFDITIQALGVTALSAPATMTFPNVFDAAPGTKLNFLSFDHTTGRLVIEGTATVSPDGKSVVTDPGTGVVRPGWHGLTPPGGEGDADPKPERDPYDPCNDPYYPRLFDEDYSPDIDQRLADYAAQDKYYLQPLGSHTYGGSGPLGTGLPYANIDEYSITIPADKLPAGFNPGDFVRSWPKDMNAIPAGRHPRVARLQRGEHVPEVPEHPARARGRGRHRHRQPGRRLRHPGAAVAGPGVRDDDRPAADLLPLLHPVRRVYPAGQPRAPGERVAGVRVHSPGRRVGHLLHPRGRHPDILGRRTRRYGAAEGRLVGVHDRHRPTLRHVRSGGPGRPPGLPETGGRGAGLHQPVRPAGRPAGARRITRPTAAAAVLAVGVRRAGRPAVRPDRQGEPGRADQAVHAAQRPVLTARVRPGGEVLGDDQRSVRRCRRHRHGAGVHPVRRQGRCGWRRAG